MSGKQPHSKAASVWKNEEAILAWSSSCSLLPTLKHSLCVHKTLTVSCFDGVEGGRENSFCRIFVQLFFSVVTQLRAKTISFPDFGQVNRLSVQHRKVTHRLSLLNLAVSGLLTVQDDLTYRRPCTRSLRVSQVVPHFLPVVLMRWNPDVNLGDLITSLGLGCFSTTPEDCWCQFGLASPSSPFLWPVGCCVVFIVDLISTVSSGQV